MAGWIFSGWPRIWRNPSVPPEIQEVLAETEYKKPTNHTDVSVWTNPGQCYDTSTPGDETTEGNLYNAVSNDPSITFHTWDTKGQTYAATTLKVKWKTSGGFTDDTFAIQYTKDGSTWLDLVAMGVHNETTIQTSPASLDANQDLTQVQVKVAFVKSGGPDKDYIYIYDIWTEGTYTPPSISISVSDGVVAYDIMPANTSKSTLAGDMPPSGDMQTATYSSTVTVNINIKGYTATGGGCDWTLDFSNGSNQYVHQFCNDTDLDCSSPPTNYTALTTAYQVLKAGVIGGGTVDFQLRLTTPNPSTCYGQQTVNVTVQAAEPT